MTLPPLLQRRRVFPAAHRRKSKKKKKLRLQRQQRRKNEPPLHLQRSELSLLRWCVGARARYAPGFSKRGGAGLGPARLTRSGATTQARRSDGIRPRTSTHAHARHSTTRHTCSQKRMQTRVWTYQQGVLAGPCVGRFACRHRDARIRKAWWWCGGTEVRVWSVPVVA